MPKSNPGSWWWWPGRIRKQRDSSRKKSNETVTRIETKPTTNMESIPLEIQAEIIKRLPIKPLIQLRSVCKSWKSLIDSSKFISDHYHHHYSNNNQSPQHLLVSHNDHPERKYISVAHQGQHHNELISCWKYFSSVQKNKHYKLSTLGVPMSLTRFHKPTILGSDQGLFCLYEFEAETHNSETEKAVIWNPTIRKSVSIHVPNVILDLPYFETILGFGVCPGTADLKLVKINHLRSFTGPEISVSCIPWQVEVFTLSSGVWRNPHQNLFSITTEFLSDGVVIDGFIYWLAFRRSEWNDLILSFDLTTEEFKEVYLPDSMATDDHDTILNISKIRDSVVVLEHFDNVMESFCVVWKMEHGVPKGTFTKLFTINPPHASLIKVLGFSSKSGEAIIQLTNDSELLPGKDEKFDVFAYEPMSEHMNHIGISGDEASSFVSSYVETLLLLDH